MARKQDELQHIARKKWINIEGSRLSVETSNCWFCVWHLGSAWCPQGKGKHKEIFDPLGFITPFTIQIKCLKRCGRKGLDGMRNCHLIRKRGGSNGVHNFRYFISCQSLCGTEQTPSCRTIIVQNCSYSAMQVKGLTVQLNICRRKQIMGEPL